MNQENPSSKRRGYLALSTIMAIAAAAAIVIPAHAVNGTGKFELDGNAISGTMSPPADDWDRVCHQVTALGFDSAGHATSPLCTSASNTTGADAVEFVHAASQNEVNFTGGGSKDPNDISSWAYTQGTGGNPGKDILLDGFAAKYHTTSTGTSGSCPTQGGTGDCKLLFFGLDRFDNSGDAQNGFWFLQNNCALGSNKIGGGKGFACTDPTPGTNPADDFHRDKDVLVVTDFSVGGGTSTITVYHWDTSCTKTTGSTAGFCGDANLRIDFTSDAASCVGAAPETPACGIVNSPGPTPPSTGPQGSPWPFADKGGNVNTYAPGEFFEAGINISNIPGLNANACFSSTLAESRSSTSTTAVLKVFILGGFGACGSSTVTTPSAGKNGTVEIPANASLSETDSAKIDVTGTSSFGGTVKFSLCQNPATNCATGGVQIGAIKPVTGSGGTATLVSDPATITKVGFYCWRAEYSGDAGVGVPPSSDPTSANDGSVNECFTVTPKQPTLTTLASITSSAGHVASISDTATLGNTANEPGTSGVLDGSVGNPSVTLGGFAQGTITFTAYGPDDCTTVVGTSTAAVNGNGPYNSASFNVDKTGTYTFVASYTGDSPNTLGAGPTACPDPGNPPTEKVTATDTASPSSTQTWLPNDSATVTSGSGKATLTGTLTIQLYDGSLDCTSGSVGGHSYSTTVTTAAASISVTSNNTDHFVNATDNVSWLVTFTSTNPNIPSPANHCESTMLTVTN